MRLHFPVVQPRRADDRAAERRVSHGVRVSCRWSAGGGRAICWRPWVWPTVSAISPPNSRGASSSGWRWRGRWSMRRDLLLADEPTGNLDSHTGGEITELIRRADTEGHLTVLMVTHDPGIAAHAEEAIRMRDGLVQRDED